MVRNGPARQDLDASCRANEGRQGTPRPIIRPAAILEEMQPLRHADDAFVFPGARHGRPLSNMAFLMLLRRMGRDDITAHGFRASFKTWASERTSFPNEIVEAALAHVVGSKVEQAYRRGDMFERRRRLMAAWATFCAAPEQKAQDKVASLHSIGPIGQ